ncbi:MAG: hypothetical protein LBG58_03240 [Planctomycetaceae bacterium]|jgi:nitrogen fixation-related uncharacterized protein|nr:hypothetical protein [Planctomycetaceae bacterium]
MKKLLITLSFVILFWSVGCDQFNDTTARLEKERAEAELEAEKLKLEREREVRAEEERKEREIRAERERKENERLNSARLKSLAKRYAKGAAEQLYDAVTLGFGGHNFRVEVTDYELNRHTSEFEIKMEIHFDGLWHPDRHYECDGTLTVDEDGSNPKFVATYINQNWQKLKSQVNTIVFVVGTAIVLNELSKE